MKRIVVGAFEIESNSLTSLKATKNDFEILSGKDIFEHLSIEEYLKENGCEIIPTISARAVSGGSVIKEDFEGILNDLLNRVPRDGSVDGVYLKLHGAMDVDGIGSGDLKIVKSIREIVGKDVPIAVAFDLHANVDPEIAEYVNVVCGYRTAPHIDIPRTEHHAVELLVKCIEENYLPKPVVIKVPIIASGDSMTTDVTPGSDLIEKVWQMEGKDECLCLNLFLGNPWVDSPYAGGTVVVIPKDKKLEEAKKQAIELAQAFWNVRGDFYFRAKTFDVEEGIDWVLEQKERPIFATDTGDNVSGGGSGDSAGLIKAFIDRKVDNVLFLGIADPVLFEKCKNFKEGEVFECSLGGSLDPKSVTIKGTATFKKSVTVDNWRCVKRIEGVLIEIAGNDIVVTSERATICQAEVFDSLGVKPQDYRCIIVKLGYLWPEFYEIAKDSCMIFTLGSTCEVVERCDFKIIPRPVYPIDKDMEWTPTV